MEKYFCMDCEDGVTLADENNGFFIHDKPAVKGNHVPNRNWVCTKHAKVDMSNNPEWSQVSQKEFEVWAALVG
jgi:hypothetical protein